MNKTKIRIRLNSGKIIERNAVLTDWVDDEGIQYTTALVSRVTYWVIDRDAYGPIFGLIA